MQVRMLRILPLLFVVVLPLYTYASTPLLCFDCKKWHPLIAVAVGSASASVQGGDKFVVGESTYTYNPQSHYTTRAFGSIAVGAEYRFRPCWSVQALLNYSQPNSFLGKGRVRQGIDTETSDLYSYQYRVISRQLLLEGKLLTDYKDCFHPYVTLGLGFSSNTAYNYDVTITPAWTAMSPLFSSKTTTSFSYAVGIGIDADFDSILHCTGCGDPTHVRGGIGYRYTNFGRTSLGTGVLNTTAVSNSPSQSDFYAHEFFVQLTYLV